MGTTAIGWIIPFHNIFNFSEHVHSSRKSCHFSALLSIFIIKSRWWVGVVFNNFVLTLATCVSWDEAKEVSKKWIFKGGLQPTYPPVNKHSNGKSPSGIGNTSSNGGFSIAMLDYRSVANFGGLFNTHLKAMCSSKVASCSKGFGVKQPPSQRHRQLSQVFSLKKQRVPMDR